MLRARVHSVARTHSSVQQRRTPSSPSSCAQALHRSIPVRAAHFRVGIAPGFGASPLIFQSFSRKENLQAALTEVIDEIQSRRRNYAHMSSAVDLSKPPGLVLFNSSAHYFADFEKISQLMPEAMVPGLVAYQKFQDAREPLVCTTVVYLPYNTNDKLKIQALQLDLLPPPSAHNISFFVAPSNRRLKDKVIRDSNSMRVAVECAGSIVASGQSYTKGGVIVHYADHNQDWMTKVMRMHFGHEFHREVYSNEGDLEFNILMRKNIFMPRNLIPSSILDQFTPRFTATPERPITSGASGGQPTVIVAKKPPGAIPSVMPVLNINLRPLRFGLFPHATLYQQELVFNNLALCVILKEAFEARSYLLLADPTYPMSFVASVTHMFVHLVPERGTPQAHLRLEYVMSPYKRCRIVSMQPMPEGFGAQQAEVELIEDEPVYATAEVEALRKRITTTLESFSAELQENYDKERLDELKSKLASADHANFSWLVASVLSARPFLAPEGTAREWLECLSVAERYNRLLAFMENHRKKLPPAGAERCRIRQQESGHFSAFACSACLLLASRSSLSMATAALVDKATNSEFLSQPDWSVNTEIIDVLNGVPELIPDTVSLIFAKMTSGDVGAQLLSLHLLDAVMKSCKATPAIFRKELKKWEAYVADKSRAPLVREKALELTDLWSRSLGGAFSDTASVLARQGLQYRGKQQPAGVGPSESPQPGRLPPLEPTSVLPPVLGAGVPGRQPPGGNGGGEVDSMREAVHVLLEILMNADPRQPIIRDEVVGQLLANLHTNIQPRIAVLIEAGNLSEELFALNDACLRVDEMYNRLKRGLPASDKPVPVVAPPRPVEPVLLPLAAKPAPAPAPVPAPMPKAPPQQIYGISVASAAAAAADVPLLRPPPASQFGSTSSPSNPIYAPAVPVSTPSAAPALAHAPMARNVSSTSALPAVQQQPQEEEDEFAMLARRPTKTTASGSGSGIYASGGMPSTPLQSVLLFPSPVPSSAPGSSANITAPSSAPAYMMPGAPVISASYAPYGAAPSAPVYAAPPPQQAAANNSGLLFPFDNTPTPILSAAPGASSSSVASLAANPPSPFANLYDLRGARP